MLKRYITLLLSILGLIPPSPEPIYVQIDTSLQALPVVQALAKHEETAISEVQQLAEEIMLETPVVESEPLTITLTIAGDCLLASDFGKVTKGSLLEKAQDEDWEWFLGGVSSYFEDDDFTIVNLENVVTEDTSLSPRHKGESVAYWYKAPTATMNILTSSSVEVADLANNHTRDYGDKGASDTIEACLNAGILFGNNDTTVYLEKDGYTVALICNGLWSEWQANDIIPRIKEAEVKSDFQIVYYHGGTERVHAPEEWRIRASRKLVDEGADLVIGNHPHVLQPREVYNGVDIIYSMGNFCFGGSKRFENRTILYRYTMTIGEDKSVQTQSEIIPCYCYTGDVNNYRPEIIEDATDKELVLQFMDWKRDKPL